MSEFELVGRAAALYLGFRLVRWALGLFYTTLLASPLKVSLLGEWALVTGSTDGIGKAYAKALAKKGLNVVLVSRSPFKLQNVAAEIEEEFKVRTKIIDIDFTTDSKDYIPKLEKEIEGLEIGILVNNVGMSYDHPKEFLELEANMDRNLVDVNITSLNAVTRVILPQMVERKKGAIVNLSSMGASFPVPMYTIYVATKAYVDNFTKNLDMEYGRKGITVQCVLPGYVKSNMSKLKKTSLFVPSPQVFANSALGRLGIYSRTTGYWAHDIQLGITRWLPSGILEKLTYNQLSTMRLKGLRKKAREQKRE